MAELRAPALDIVVGGLGLGYTTEAILHDTRVESLIVVEAMAEVIEWHERGVIRLGSVLTSDPRCTLVQGDYFDMAASSSLDVQSPGRRFHAIIVDIDHSPRQPLHPSHAAFYDPNSLKQIVRQLKPGGVFALWSNDPPDPLFCSAAGAVFETARAELVRFSNPLCDREEAATIYVARSA